LAGTVARVGRKNRRRDEEPPLDHDRARRGLEVVHSAADGSWSVRHIPVDAAIRTYRCPGCDQEIPPGVAHVVAWPADERGDVADRRHWHTACWRARDRRRPTGRRP
jgi:hypothetical protein